jgi:ATP-dependent DNA helicase RecG
MTRENQNIEWKESWRDEYLRWVSGFANGQGGVLVIGRNDRGEPVGVADGSKLLADLPNKIRDLLGIMVDVNLLRTKYMKAAISYQGIQRIERFPVPYEALRETVLNALVHRDYAVPAPIQIRVYEHKLRVWNPAVLPDGWDLEKLLGAHASHPYNPDVANAFFRSGEIESWGRGIEKIFSACRRADTPPPNIHVDGHDLWVKFVFSPQYMAAIQGETGSKKSTAQKTIQKTAQKILDILKSDPEISRAKIAEQLGDITESGVKYHLAKMKREGLIRRVGPDKGGHWEVLK